MADEATVWFASTKNSVTEIALLSEGEVEGKPQLVVIGGANVVDMCLGVPEGATGRSAIARDASYMLGAMPAPTAASRLAQRLMAAALGCCRAGCCRAESGSSCAGGAPAGVTWPDAPPRRWRKLWAPSWRWRCGLRCCGLRCCGLR